MNIDNIKFKVSEEKNGTYIIANPEKSFYTIKIKLNKNARRGEEIIKYLKENISDIDVKIF